MERVLFFSKIRVNTTVENTYLGKFKDGKRHGKGHFKDVNGTYFEEDWEMNQLVTKKETTGQIRFDVLSCLIKNFKEAQELNAHGESPGKAGELPPSIQNKLPEFESEVNEFNQDSPQRGENHRLMMCRNSRVGNETLSLQEFKENLGSFEKKFEDALGTCRFTCSQAVGY